MAGTMTGAVFKGDGELVLEKRPIPKLENPGDVLVQVEAVGICGTDVHILRVPPVHPATRDVILGHEFAGRIAEVGSAVENVAVGDPVAVDPNAPCGHCDMCQGGYPNACEVIKSCPVPGFFNTRGIFRDGSMARYIVYPATEVHKIAPHVSLAHAAVIEPLAVALNGLEKIPLRIGETVVVLGGGPIGLMFAGLAKRTGGRVIVSEPIPMRREAAVALGVDLVVDPMQEDLEEVVKAETDGKGADVVGDFVGNMLDVAVEIAGFGGRIVVGGCQENARPAISQVWVLMRELMIVGAVLPKYTFLRAIKVLEQELLPMDIIVSHQLPLSRVHEGFQLVREGKAIKVVFCPTDEDVQL